MGALAWSELRLWVAGAVSLSQVYGTFLMADVYHETVYFTGHVQGVGFRYSTLAVSHEFEVAGYVCNLPDGRVQVEAEGAKADVKAFVQTVHDRMHGFIRKVDRYDSMRPAQYRGFTIR